MAISRDEARYWLTQLEEQRRSGLKTMRESAAKWQGTIAALLGVFGSAAFIKGPSTFKDLGAGEPWSSLLLAGTFVAAALAFAGLGFTVLAAQGIPKIEHFWTSVDLRKWTYQEMKKAFAFLKIGRLLTMGAVIVILVGSVAMPVLAFVQASPPQVRALVIRTNGDVFCGVLENPANVRLKVSDQNSMALAPGDDIQIVERCPK